jgi:hypothetical protein
MMTNVLKKETPIYGINNLHLWIGLILLVLLFFEDSLGHINQPSEIKEFLFSPCFLVFAYKVRGAVIHSISS